MQETSATTGKQYRTFQILNKAEHKGSVVIKTARFETKITGFETKTKTKIARFEIKTKTIRFKTKTASFKTEIKPKITRFKTMSYRLTLRPRARSLCSI